MTKPKEDPDAKAFREKQEEALQIMADKDPEFPTDAATTNERLSSLDDPTSAEIKASLALNNPAGSHSSYRDEKAEKKLSEQRAKDAE